ncbi:hypothetical protein QVD17_32300 [Tagetes erecta]|uniref:Legume lectin domain-containing protein n=1 Tax=Tagetes erecta TaxID=13708 RepID=A0AAD8NPB8_TARER|nr:hypothetical protein QVD17_32300 [Tagetes erecta]
MGRLGCQIRLNSGNRLQAWIDYESNSKRLEVRLSKFGGKRHVDPLLFQQIDLPKIWPENDGFLVGLSSSSQICNVYSWSFKTRQSRDWVHSESLDPIGFMKGEEKVIKIRKKDECVMKILSALILRGGGRRR